MNSRTKQLLYVLLYMWWKRPEDFAPYDANVWPNILETWFQPYTSLQDIYDELTVYPTETYPDVCVCGNVIASTGSNLRYHCPSCRGANGIWRLCKVTIKDISCFIGAPYKKYVPIQVATIEAILSQVIYDSRTRNS